MFDFSVLNILFSVINIYLILLRLYIEAGQGVNPDSGKCLVWKNGDEIRAVVSLMEKNQTIQLDDAIKVEFYVNTLLVCIFNLTFWDQTPFRIEVV